uniref:G_PROTEIN_RECEP_F1_2 domain-containing protein n=1 Tax=Caenorhabditis japonica TaxID=281687 RepID=A0A8R1HI50_CAEJA
MLYVFLDLHFILLLLHQPGFEELMNETEIEAAMAAIELEDQLLRPEWFYLILSIVPLVCILGNLMVVAAVWTTKSLQTPTNHLLVSQSVSMIKVFSIEFQVSLAMADLIVGAFVMPFSIYLSINGLHWHLPLFVCYFYCVLDVAASTSSIIHLVLISIDRLVAATKPAEYKTMKHKKRVYLAIAITWMFSIALSLPLGTGFNTRTSHFLVIEHHCGIYNPIYMLGSSIFAFYLPCLIMIFTYGYIFYTLRKRLQAIQLQEMAGGQFLGFGADVGNITTSAIQSVIGIAPKNRNMITWEKPLLKKIEETAAEHASSLNDSEREQRGLGSAEIARRLQISSSTVRNVVAAIKKRGDASEVKKSGRPRSVNTRNTRAIIKKRIIRNDGLSLNRMASQLGIARSTVQSIVKNDLKLKSYKLRRGQYLSDKSKAMRLEKCRKLLQHFQVRRVSDVIWTDEKIFTIEPLPNRQNQRQLLSKGDSMSPKRRLAHNRLFPKSVMVWAGITATGKTPLVFIERNVKINSEVYQKIVLMDNLLPWVTQHFAGGPFILQQDWAPSHGSRSTLAVLEAHFPGFLDKNLWPASSPDLNPMDFSVWGMLEGKIAGKVFATVDDLKAALEVAWASIDDGYLRRTVNSVKKRLRACVKARGSNFEILL